MALPGLFLLFFFLFLCLDGFHHKGKCYKKDRAAFIYNKTDFFALFKKDDVTLACGK